MNLSKFGRKLSSRHGIVSLMEDLGEALNVNPDLLFLGGGNPAYVSEFEALVAKELITLAQDPLRLHKMVGVYQSPQGSEEFIAELSRYFKQECGWPVGPENILITNGSQAAFFLLINVLAGGGESLEHKEILMPMMPEYLGYAEQGVDHHMFVGRRPLIEILGDHEFKYRIDFDRLGISDNTAAMCVSRPSNPTANMLDDQELNRLTMLAEEHNIPLILDCAYGDPFPGIVYEQKTNLWSERSIFVLSLSKLGLPGARTGIVVAQPELIEKLAAVNTITSLASGSFGPAVMTELLKKGLVSDISQTLLLPYYREKRDFILARIHHYFIDFPYLVHKAEGAFFVWIWFKDLPVSSRELYLRLKAEGVLVMDGSPFFFGLDKPWKHSEECIRLSYCQDSEVIDRALRIMGRVLADIYS